MPHMRAPGLTGRHRLLRQSRAAACCRTIVIGDLHGSYDSLLRMLQTAGVLDNQHGWVADDRTHLVVLGDMVDEGPDSFEVVHLLKRLLQRSPEAVHVLLGNHEVLLLRAVSGEDQLLDWQTAWSWAAHHAGLAACLLESGVPRLTGQAIRTSFVETYRTTGLATPPADYLAAVAATPGVLRSRAARLLGDVLRLDGTLDWLSSLPVALRIGDWGFFHGGPPASFPGTIADLNAEVRNLVCGRHWDHHLLEPYRSVQSAIAARGWAKDETEVSRLLRQFDIKRVAFGHSPGALDGVFGHLCHRWGTVFKADAYAGLGIEGFLELLDNEAWAIYTKESLPMFWLVNPDSDGIADVNPLHAECRELNRRDDRDARP